jgi:hypothetical protein
MHTSQNSVLAKQLAIAIGNLLGKPGEFYKYITGKDSKRNGHIESLFTETTKNSNKMVTSCSCKPLSAESKKNLSKKFKKVGHLFEDDKLKESFALLKTLATTIVKTIINQDEDLEEEYYLEHMFPINQKIGLWWWFINQADEFLEDSTPEIIRIDILITLYFISTFRVKKP